MATVLIYISFFFQGEDIFAALLKITGNGDVSVKIVQNNTNKDTNMLKSGMIKLQTECLYSFVLVLECPLVFLLD